jgi:hypothetical protein
MLRTYKAAIVLSALMNVGTISFHVMLVLQSCTDPLQVLPGSSCETFPSSSDGTYGIGNIKFEEVIHIKKEEKVDVKAEKGIDSEEEECLDIKYEEGIHSEEEQEEEDMGIEEEGVDIKEEVSCEDTM